jgi:hypothetical protein
MDEKISPTKNIMAERIQEVVDRLIRSLRTEQQQRRFALYILVATVILGDSDSVAIHRERELLERHYLETAGDAMLPSHRDSIEQIVEWIHSGQAAAVAEAANHFLHPRDDGHPPAVVRAGGSNVENISDLTGEHSARTGETNPLSESTGSERSGPTDHDAFSEN